MSKTYIFTFALLTLLFAACSEDDILRTPSTGETEGTETVTFTATVDYSIEEMGNGAAKASTRAISATDDDIPTRFYAQAVSGSGTSAALSNVVEGVQNGDKYAFTFQSLRPGTQYTFMFWADNADGDAETPTDLRSIPYSAGDIAFAAKAEGTPESVEKTVDMKHVVTKVTLQHSGINAFSPQTGDVLAVSLPCATTYNVATATASGNSTQSVEHTFSNDASISEATPICSFYNLAPASTADITLTFINDYTLTIGNAALPANAHVTLQGDLSSSNSGWIMSNEEKRAEVFYSCLFDGNNPKGNFVADAYELFSDNRTGIWFIEHILNITRANGTYRIKIGEYSFNCQLINTTSQNSCIIITTNGYTFNIAYGTLYDHETKDFQLPSDIRTNW